MFYNSTSSDRVQSTVRFVSHRVFLIILIFLAVVILFLGRADSKALDSLRTNAAEALSGVFSVFSSPVGSVMSGVDGVRNFFLVHEDNERLRVENARLMQWKALAEKLQDRVASYEALLKVEPDPRIGFVTARAVSDGGSPFVRTLIVNAGSAQGVAKGQAVINDRGLVGWVVGAGEGASRILLATDLNSRIPVKIGPEGQRAIMIGDNSATPRLEFLITTGAVEPGDTVMTSGDGGVLPPGLPIGQIEGRDATGAYRVAWTAGDGPIDFVRILNYSFPRELEAPAPVPPAPETPVAEAADTGAGMPAIRTDGVDADGQAAGAPEDDSAPASDETAPPAGADGET